MISSFKSTKYYFENLFSTLWTDTPIHYAGQEFNGDGVEKWVNPFYTPRGGSNFGVSNEASVGMGVLYVACWTDNDTDCMELADDIVAFVNTNIDNTSYKIGRFEIDDHGWNESSKVFMIVNFAIETVDGVC